MYWLSIDHIKKTFTVYEGVLPCLYRDKSFEFIEQDAQFIKIIIDAHHVLTIPQNKCIIDETL